jgi:hypothetical protein
LVLERLAQVLDKKVLINILQNLKGTKDKVDNMIKLLDLLKEDNIVKNKKTGNIYIVKQMDPNKHEKPSPAEVEKAKAKSGGVLPKVGQEPSTPQEPQQQKTQ